MSSENIDAEIAALKNQVFTLLVALIVVTLLVLHRPIGTTGGGALQARAVPPTTPALVRPR